MEIATASIEFIKIAWALAEYCKDVKDAPEDMVTYQVEAENIARRIERLQERAANSDDPGSEEIRRFLSSEISDQNEFKPGTVLGELQRLYKELDKKLGLKEYASKYRDSRLRKGWQRVKWPISEKDTTKILTQVSRLSQRLKDEVDVADTQVALDTRRLIKEQHEELTSRFGSDVQLLSERVGELTKDFRELKHNTNEKTDQDNYRDISKWLSPLSFEDVQSRLLKDAVGTGDWVIDEPEFQEWLDGRPWRLQLFGAPGAGKTVMASFIIDYLERLCKDKGSGHVVLYLFLKNEQSNTQTTTRLLASLLRQMNAQNWRRKRAIIHEIRELWSQCLAGPTQPPEKEVMTILLNQIKQLSRTYIVIDGLDEASEKTRSDLLRELRRLQRTGRASLLITSRQLQDLKDPMSTLFCDQCKHPPVGIFYRCKAHGAAYHICRNCKPTNTTCTEPPHSLIEPYKHVDLSLTPPRDAIVQYIKREIQRIKQLGRDDDDQSNSDESDEDSDEKSYRSLVGTETLGRLLSSNAALESEIPERIADSADGLFMLARLQWKEVEAAGSIRKIRAALKNLPKGYTDSYDQTMARIVNKSTDDRKLALRALRWVYYSKRPLTLDELRHALATEDVLADGDDGFDEEALVEPGRLLETTAGLITFPKDGSSVSLTHFTAREYLDSSHAKWFSDAETSISTVLLSYLLYDEFKEPCTGSDEDEEVLARLGKLPLAAYAAQHWGFHTQSVQRDSKISVLVLKLLHAAGNLASAVQISFSQETREPTGWTIRKRVNALHVASWFGLDSVIPQLVREGLGVNEPDGDKFQGTPLFYACRSGSVPAVQALIRCGANVHWENPRCRKSLMEAALNNRVDVIDVLCRRDELDVNAADRNERTALLLAAHRGHVAAVEKLLSFVRVDVNAQDRLGYTALMAGIINGSTQMVKAVLERDGVDVNLTERNDDTPLMIAAEKGQEEIVEMLLSKGARKDETNNRGSTALSLAVDGGHIEVAEQLFVKQDLESGLYLDHYGRSPLHTAAQNNHNNLAEWLIAQGFEVDATDVYGQTPLHLAAESGHADLATLLISKGASKTTLDFDGNTPATLASREEHTTLANILQVDDDGSPHATTGASATTTNLTESEQPAWLLAKKGRLDLLRLRAAQTPNDLSTPNTATKNTPLHLAVENGHLSCARFLLEHLSSSTTISLLNALNSELRTPLHLAAGSVQPEMVDLLLAQEPAPELDLEDITGKTALGWAVWRDDRESAVALIEAGAAFDADTGRLEDVLRRAIEEERLYAVKRIVRSGLVAVDYGLLQMARAGEKGEVRRILNAYKSMKIEPKIGGRVASGRSPVTGLGEGVGGAVVVREPVIGEEEDESEVKGVQNDQQGGGGGKGVVKRVEPVRKPGMVNKVDTPESDDVLLSNDSADSSAVASPTAGRQPDFSKPAFRSRPLLAE